MKALIFSILITLSISILAESDNKSYENLKILLREHPEKSSLKNYTEAIEKNTPMAESGDAAAMFTLYVNYNLLANIYKIPDAAPEGIKWLEKSADAGNSEALATLGHIHKNGNVMYEINKNLEKAAEYFKSAWKKGHSSSKTEYEYITECLLPDIKAFDC